MLLILKLAMFNLNVKVTPMVFIVRIKFKLTAFIKTESAFIVYILALQFQRCKNVLNTLLMRF